MPRHAKIRVIARGIDAERADDYAERLALSLPEGSEAHAIGTLLCTAYPALSAVIEAEPEIALAIAEEGYQVARDRRGLAARLTARVLGGDAPPVPLTSDDSERIARELRRAARDERIRIALRELLPASLGGADVDVTAFELSELAEITIDLALTEAIAFVSGRLGAPRTASGEPARITVLGMGKLGGGELNAGSDVDLIFLYDTDDGAAIGPNGDATSLHEVWTRVARRTTVTLEEPTADGIVWRVDLRLRPEGRSGPLVNSLAAAERYYEAFGRLWERAALLRARPVAGSLALGEEILTAIGSFIWRKNVDPSIAIEMTRLVRRARAELSPEAERDLKHAVGGIREAEFFVQALQLIWGGREPRIRVKGTLEALARLRATGLVSDREHRDVTDAYLALRRAEHAVQVASGVQTHLVPSDPKDATRMARALGFPSLAAFSSDLRRHTMQVAERFASLVPEGPPPPSRWIEAIAALDRSNREGFAEALARAGVGVVAQEGAIQTDDVARDLFELARLPDRPLGARTREKYPLLAEAVLDAIADAANPEQAARYLRMFVTRLGHPGVYARILGNAPQAVRRLVEALGSSAFIGDVVANNPELGDEVLFSRDVPTPEMAGEEVRLSIDDRRADEDDEEEALLGSLRRAKARVTLRVGLAHLSGEIDTRVATRTLSALADASLEAATRFALQTAENEPVRGLSVLAMGKLGGQDIGYGSDLDVIFLFDPLAAPEGKDAGAYFSRCARRIIRLISMSHGAGPGYELDTRLRPSGNQGLLVTSIEAFARYHGYASPGRGEAATSTPHVKAAAWERLALLRVRVVAGDRELGAQALEVARATAYGEVDDPVAAAEEIHRMRMRMEQERSIERAGRYDLKLGRGGLIDIEFCVQALQMRYGSDPSVQTTEVLIAIDALALGGHLRPEDAEVLREGYAFLRELEERIRIVHADSSHLLEESAPGLAPLARRMGIRDRPGSEAAAELLARYREVTDRVRSVYEATLLPGE